jgi:MFS family permease
VRNFYLFFLQGWRYVFIVSGIPGLVIALILVATVKEPERKRMPSATQIQDELTCMQKTKGVVTTFLSPSLFMLCLAGAIRNAGEDLGNKRLKVF